MIRLHDQLGRELQFKTAPKRIVSLVPSQTELLVDLGLEAFIVGVTKFCVHPVHIRKSATIVGGTKQVHYDKIKALQPDVILCNKEENTKEMVEALENIAPVHVSEIYTIHDTVDLIEHYGKLFTIESKANSINVQLVQLYNAFKADMELKKPIKVAYFIWRKPWMVAANNTIIQHLLSLNKFENVYTELNRYPEVSIETLKTTHQPDVILLSSEPYPFKEKHILELQQILPQQQILLVDGEYFSWYGTRLLGAFDYFKTLRTKIETLV
ncbi:MAG: ABC transporter substrate-binding protein [Flavobacteriaceae bacterium]